MSGRYRREDFDPGREFVALRSFVFSAAGHVPGQPILKTKFTVRRLRQLFDRRDVGYPSEYWQKLGFVPPDGAQQPMVLDEEPKEPVQPVEAPKRAVVPRYRPQNAPGTTVPEVKRHRRLSA